MKRRSLYYILIVGGLVSLFATCKNIIVDDDEEVEEQDSIELEFSKVDEDAKAIPMKLSLSPLENYTFVRNRNPYNQNYFRNPFDSAIYVSGTFCELRGNHFHGGLDIRTGGKEGWPVLASADGYVERVKVNTKGYGRVVYVRHPNGYTSVYGHLQKFTGALANYVKEAQYAQRKFEIELFPKAGQIKVKKGVQFAVSGNTGGSGGPHLHFEIRNSRGTSTNPLMHGLIVNDNINPVIKNVAVYLKDKQVLYSEGNYPYKVINQGSEYFKKTKALNVKPGTYSFGLHTDDYFTDKNNRLGINYCWLTANGKLLYQYQIEKFDFGVGRYINTHTDPYLDFKTNKTYIRLFKERFNPLPYYKQAQNGEIWLRQGDSVQLKLFIEDYAGLKDSVTWIMVGDTLAQKLVFEDKTTPFDQKHRISKASGKSIKYKQWKINIPSKAVYHNFDFKLKEKLPKPNMLSNTLQMHYGYTPLHTYVNVSYQVPSKWLKYGNKLCVVSYDGKKRYYEGGKLQGDKLVFRTRSLGEYAITKDDNPPVIKPISTGKYFKFRVTENLSAIKKVICSLDGKWILAEYEPKKNLVWGEIPKWIKPGSYEFKLIVIDGRNNRAEFKKKMNL